MKHFRAIAAMSENRVIGAGNRIPWHLPQECNCSKHMKPGLNAVMGR